MTQIVFHSTNRLITLGIGLMLMLNSCKSEFNSEKIIPENVILEESWFNSISPNPDIDQVNNLMKKDSSLTQIIVGAILGVSKSSPVDSAVLHYLSDSINLRLKDSCEKAFSNFDWNKSLGLPLAKFKADFPEKSVPAFYTLITGFNYGIFYFQDQYGLDAIGIGKEMFLGNTALYDHLSITNPNFSSYINRTFNTTHLPEKIITAIVVDILPDPPSNRLLDYILNEGKKLYLIKKWMPELADSTWFETTQDQFLWTKNNELDIWRFLLTDKLIYKNSSKDIANLTQPAPHSMGMPPEAPGRAINYIGYKIIENYMKSTGASCKDLALEKDYDKILQSSKYKPR